MTQTQIKIDHTRDDNITPFGKVTLSNQYCLPGENIQDAFARAATAFSGGDDALAQRLYDYASKQWFAFATPLLANGGTNRGLPISCFLNYVEDSIDGLAENFRENAFLSTNGGGIGTFWGHVRSAGEHTSRGVDTPGVMPFMHVQDAQVLAYHQGATRRGSAATYMDVSHPEIHEFINMRSSTGGDVHRKNENLHHGVCIPDSFMEAVASNANWDLIDPHSKRIHSTVKARELWIKILQQRAKLGEPYLFFIDTANKALPQSQKDKGLYINHSNLCTEITLPTGKDRTAVCCLSSINVAKLGEWWQEREQFVSDLITMLDNTIDVFCEMAPKAMWRAVNSAKQERSLGLGTLGFHTWLQQNGISMSSIEAEDFNRDFYKELNLLAKKASRHLATTRGEPEDMKGTGYRNAHLMAIAPNASSSIICGGVSPSIEPLAANAFTQKTKAGSHEVRNPALQARLRNLGQDTDEVWQSIALNKGSVQHLNFLSLKEKEVFLTAIETDAMIMIKLAADRQPFICQAQSVNLFLPSNVDAKTLHQTHFAAWKKGLKSLYYLRTTSVKNTSVGVMPELLKTPEPEGKVCSMEPGCTSCEG
jgi:ribonucleoside-diphosphate reductase alpha chain